MARNKGQRDLNTALAFGMSNKALRPGLRALRAGA